MARFIGFDAHRTYAYVVELRDGKRQEYRVELPDGLGDFKLRLDPSAQLVLEASTGSFRLADEIRPHVGRLVVADSIQTRGAVSGAAITDRSAAEALAKLLASDFVREVWVPPLEIRSLRNLVEIRVKLARMRGAATNRLRALLAQELLPGLPKKTDWSEEAILAMIGSERGLRDYCSQLCRIRSFLEVELETLDARLRSWSRNSKEARLLMSIPGIGPIVAACICIQIGDVKRFTSPGKLCSYAGLVPRVHDSGQTRRSGSITRAGRRCLRWAASVAAITAVRLDGPFRQFKDRLSERRPKGVALTACARKILVAVWKVWISGKPFIGQEERHARKLKVLGLPGKDVHQESLTRKEQLRPNMVAQSPRPDGMLVPKRQTARKPMEDMGTPGSGKADSPNIKVGRPKGSKNKGPGSARRNEIEQPGQLSNKDSAKNDFPPNSAPFSTGSGTAQDGQP